jgi:hypothetical protein
MQKTRDLQYLTTPIKPLSHLISMKILKHTKLKANPIPPKKNKTETELKLNCHRADTDTDTDSVSASDSV